MNNLYHVNILLNRLDAAPTADLFILEDNPTAAAIAALEENGTSVMDVLVVLSETSQVSFFDVAYKHGSFSSSRTEEFPRTTGKPFIWKP